MTNRRSLGWLALPLCLGLAQAASAQSGGDGMAEMRARTAEIARRYLDVWSNNAEASVEGVPYVYGPQIRFYGRLYNQRQLEAEKRRAIEQWPIRRYVHRPGSMRVICNARTLKCAARSIIDYRVANPSRGQAKHGSATFDLGISFAGPRPVVLYETGGRVRQGG